MRPRRSKHSREGRGRWPSKAAVPQGTFGETRLRVEDSRSFELGVLRGVLIGGGHFGGDRFQPHVTVKLHVRHKPLLDWLLDRCPGARLYGPYEYDRRKFYQLMVRGGALRNRLIPLRDSLPWPEIDEYTYGRYLAMKARYGIGAEAGDETAGTG